MKKHLLISVITCSLLASSCTKQPTASFSISNTAPAVGETVTFSNASTHAQSYQWFINNTGWTTEASPSNVFNSSGTYYIKLIAYNGKKQSEVQQVVTVPPQNGDVTFWQNTLNFTFNVNVLIGSGPQQAINSPEASAPPCNDAGSANFSLAPGTYSYVAWQDSPGAQNWSGNVTVTENGCALVELY